MLIGSSDHAEPSPGDPREAPVDAAVGDGAVVAIGFSAGGLDTVRTFFDLMPAGHGIAFVVVCHHSPKAPSYLREILARHTQMPVVTAEQGMELLPERVHVIPPGAGAILSNGRFQLDGERWRGRPLKPIDAFFRSLAGERGRMAIGVVLSGTGRDGSLGVEEIRRAGGFTMAQDEESAPYPDMPREAVATGFVDRVVAVEQCPGEIISHLETRRGTAPAVDSSAAGDARFIGLIVARVREATGFDMSIYKPAVLRRRVARRMRLRNVSSLEAYAEGLEVFPDEVHELAGEVLIRVTSFFRDPEAFEVLADALGDLLAGKPEGAVIRVWVPACATGQEALSIAILLREAMERARRFHPVRIVASDVDPSAIAVARTGTYREREVLAMAPERLRRFFTRTGDSYRIDPDILDLVTFSVQSITDPAPMADVDLVSCRNVLMFLTAGAQRQVLATVTDALRPGGIVVLGRAESLGPFGPQFVAVDAEWRVFRRTGAEVTARPPRAPEPAAALAPGLPATLDEERGAEYEELQIANQQLSSMVDELRASNLDLSASLEEMRSRNQELEAELGRLSRHA